MPILVAVFFGQGAGSDWQAQRQSAISGSGGNPEFLGCGTLAVFFRFRERLMDSFGLRSGFCQVYCVLCHCLTCKHRNLHPPKVG